MNADLHSPRTHIEHLVASIPAALMSQTPTLHRLDLATSIIEQAELWRAQLAEQARSEGHSWAHIGQCTGMTKQAAQQRWGRKPSGSVDAGTSPLF